MLNLKFFGREYFISKKVLIAVVLPAVLIIAGFIFVSGYFISRNNNGIIVEKNSGAELSDTSAVSEDTDFSEEASRKNLPKIKVYVVGAVKHPCVVELEKGQIIEDAINAAGGAKPDADLENINLAYVLNENVMIKIKTKKEVQAEMQGVLAKTNPAAQNGTGEGIKISNDNGGAVVNDNSSKMESAAKVNINTATLEELDRLDGVGQATAKKIIDYREKSGPFKTIEDIKKVSGIGDAKFNSFKDMITVG